MNRLQSTSEVLVSNSAEQKSGRNIHCIYYSSRISSNEYRDKRKYCFCQRIFVQYAEFLAYLYNDCSTLIYLVSVIHRINFIIFLLSIKPVIQNTSHPSFDRLTGHRMPVSAISQDTRRTFIYRLMKTRYVNKLRLS